MPVPEFMRARAAAAAVLAFLAACTAVGCQRTYRKATESIAADVAAGRYAQASREAAAALDSVSESDVDRFAYLLEAGRTAQLAGDLSASQRAFGEASAKARPFLDEKAEASVVEGVSTTLFNQTLSLYRGTGPDRILLESLIARNALVEARADQARLALNRAQAWQQAAVALNAAEIEARQDSIDESKREASEKNVQYDDPNQIGSNEKYANLASMSAYADFADPFATYLRGVFLLFERDAADLENASYAFRRTQALHDGDAAIARLVAGDLALVDERRTVGTSAPRTWIFLFDGLAAHRKQFSVGIAAFPYMVRSEPVLRAPAVRGGGATQDLALVADIDRMVMADFKQKLPLIIAQEILSTALKSAATYALKERYGSYGLLIGAAFQLGSTAADLRCWRTAPQRILVARIETPADGRIELLDGAGAICSIDVEPGSSNVVFVDAPGRAARPATAAGRLGQPSQGTMSEAR